MGTNYVKVKSNDTQNIKDWLCRDRDERINHIRIECSRMVQKGMQE